MILNLRVCHGSLQRSCVRSFVWWNECPGSATIKLRSKGSLFFLTIPFKRECYCQWSLACKSGSYQKCHKAAWGLCNFLQVEGTQMSQRWAAFYKSKDQQTDGQTESSVQGQSIRNRTTDLQTYTLTSRPYLPCLLITMKSSCITVSDVWQLILSDSPRS